MSLSGILTTVAMLYVEKDLSQCVKVAFDKWDTHREMLNHRYFYVANMRISPHQYAQAIEKGIIPRRGKERGWLCGHLQLAFCLCSLFFLPDLDLLFLNLIFLSLFFLSNPVKAPFHHTRFLPLLPTSFILTADLLFSLRS